MPCYKIYLLGIAIIALANLRAKGQTITKKFDNLFYNENFDSSKTLWPVISNTDNLVIVQNGEYLINRKSQTTPFAVVSEIKPDQKGFRISTAIKIEKAALPASYFGVMFMIQPENSGGIFLEFNTGKEFRVRKLSNGKFTFYTGTEKSQGWVKNSFITDPLAYLNTDITGFGGQFDFYFNHKLAFSINETEFESGNIGYSIGAATIGKVDFICVFGAETKSVIKLADTIKSNQDLSTLLESIIRLKTQVNTLTEENDLLKHTIDAMKSQAENDAANTRLMQQKLSVYDQEMLEAQQRFDSLSNLNEELIRYKEMVAGNENGDLVITLSKSLKAEIEKNKTLTDSISKLNKVLTQKTSANGSTQTNTGSGTKNPSSQKPKTTTTSATITNPPSTTPSKQTPKK